MDRESLTGSGGRSVIAFEQALARPMDEAFPAFARHVNVVEARLLRLGNFAKLYTRAEGLFLYDDRGRRYMDFTAVLRIA